MRAAIVWACFAWMGWAFAVDAPAGRYVEVSPENTEALADLLARIDALVGSDLSDVDRW